MHNSIKDFIGRMRRENQAGSIVDRVAEFGSFDINGNPRSFFPNVKEYVGIDWRPGPNVDVVSLAHEYTPHKDGSVVPYFDFVISTSTLEHDPFWSLTIRRMVDLLKEGGSLILTCAGPGFHRHEVETAPPYVRGVAQEVKAGVYYHNLPVTDVLTELTRAGRFKMFHVEDSTEFKDVMIFARGKMPVDAGMATMGVM